MLVPSDTRINVKQLNQKKTDFILSFCSFVHRNALKNVSLVINLYPEQVKSAIFRSYNDERTRLDIRLYLGDIICQSDNFITQVFKEKGNSF